MRSRLTPYRAAMSPPRCAEPPSDDGSSGRNRDRAVQHATVAGAGAPGPAARDPEWPRARLSPTPSSRVESHKLVAFPYTHTIRAGCRRPSMGFWCPTTLAAAGSDQHQVYQAWLCCAFRFSQPLDALFRLQPLRPCFMPVAPLGFRFQRVPLPGSGRRLSAPPALRAVLSTDTVHLPGQYLSRPATSRVCAPEESVHVGPVLPGVRRPILS